MRAFLLATALVLGPFFVHPPAALAADPGGTTSPALSAAPGPWPTPTPAPAPAPSTALPRSYAITDMGTLGGDTSAALGVNTDGIAVGWSETAAGERHPFVFFPPPCEGFFCLAGMLDLTVQHPEAADDDAFGTAIDDQLRAVGQSFADDAYTSFWWDFEEQSMALFYGRRYTDITDGVSVGWYEHPNGDRSFRAGGGLDYHGDLGTLGGDTRAKGTNGFWAVGSSDVEPGVSRAFAWYPLSVYPLSEMVDLGTLAGHDESWANDVNGAADRSAGERLVVGASRDGLLVRATLWDTYFNGAYLTSYPVNLGSLGGLASEARALNADGVAVGWSLDSLQHKRAVVWPDRNTIRDLNDLAPDDSPFTVLTQATDVSDAGHIVGQGVIDGETHGFLMTPCEFAFDPPLLSVPANGGTYTIELEATHGCDWILSESYPQSPFFFVLSEPSGEGPAEILLNVTANTSTEPRAGTLSVFLEGVGLPIQQAGQTLTIAPRTFGGFSLR